MNEKPKSNTNFSPCGTARSMGPGPAQVIHYYIGMSGRSYLSHCGLKIDKNEEGVGWIRLETDIFDAVDSPNLHSERKKTMCPTCGELGALVALGNTEL